jgi:hypothetical protein
VVETQILMGLEQPLALAGNVTEKYRQAGNGLPPQLAGAACGAVAKALGLVPELS